MQSTAQTKTPRSTHLPDLSQFTGTEHYYAWALSPKFKYTDGVKYMAERANAYWLLDVVFSHTIEIYRSRTIPDDQKRFLACKLTVSDNDTALFIITDGDDNELARQEIEYTDFPAKEQEIWVQNGVAILPSEY